MVLVVAEEKMSSYYPHAQAAFLTIFDHTTERALKPNLLWIFALEMNRYMTTYGISKEDIARVSVQHKRNAAGHPVRAAGRRGYHRSRTCSTRRCSPGRCSASTSAR